MDNLPIILCGSGASVPFDKTLNPKLKEIIEGNISIGLNYWFKYGCETTINTFVDYQFYENNIKELEKLPLIVGSHNPNLQSHKKDIIHSNTILLKNSGIYNGKESISKGVYCKQLVGMWTLSLAIALGFKEIYLLGYDCCKINNKTHFYQDVVNLNQKTPIYIKGKKVNSRLHFRGVGTNSKGQYKTSTYNSVKHLNEKWFAPFKSEQDIKIYNVSPKSVLTVFPKISYDEFYTQVKNNGVFQNQARAVLRSNIYENSNHNND